MRDNNFETLLNIEFAIWYPSPVESGGSINFTAVVSVCPITSIEKERSREELFYSYISFEKRIKCSFILFFIHLHQSALSQLLMPDTICSFQRIINFLTCKV
jgi:hypothetical protein